MDTFVGVAMVRQMRIREHGKVPNNETNGIDKRPNIWLIHFGRPTVW
ncbi:hypothetical protein L843_3401 [Mycobacterium intracellulare MIN_061107_1834]|nr:hypothetical protein L843_3401 [Mycobacterium intracellulare MIN_061107_1834]